MALKKVFESTSEKSGANRNENALAKPPLRIPFMTIKISRTPSIGINILTILPIPSLIPADTINAVKVMKTVCQNSRLRGEEITFEN